MTDFPLALSGLLLSHQKRIVILVGIRGVGGEVGWWIIYLEDS